MQNSRAQRAIVSADESRKRMQLFDERRDEFIARVRAGGGGRVIQIVADPAILDQMHQFREPLEIVSASGQVLGHFLPKSHALPADAPFTEFQLQAMEDEPGGRPLAEILKDFEQQ